MAYCAVYAKEFPDTDPCPHCKYSREMESVDPSEFHWVSAPGAHPTICEFRGGWYWTDETQDFGNYEPCATRAEAEAEQAEYAKRL